MAEPLIPHAPDGDKTDVRVRKAIDVIRLWLNPLLRDDQIVRNSPNDTPSATLNFAHEQNILANQIFGK